jgi:hypothetical protein
MNKITIGGEEFPDTCPDNCPQKGQPLSQGDICHRCPIFNCTGKDPLLSPEDYRSDIAKDYKEWFDKWMEKSN